MRGFLYIVVAGAGVLALAWFGADFAVRSLERQTHETLTRSLVAGGHDWAEVEADGLRVALSGTAPSESARFRVLEVAARLVDTNRISDDIAVAADTAEADPDFSLEILRNGRELSLIGLLPGAEARIQVLDALTELTDDTNFTDLAEAVDYDVPEGWSPAVELGLKIATDLSRSRIVVAPGRVEADAVLPADSDIAAIEASYSEAAADGLDLEMRFEAPKPVMSPYAFSADVAEGAISVGVCGAETEDDRAKIITALEGGIEDEDCGLVLGAPTPLWPDAVAAAVVALQDIDDGSVTISDLDIVVTATLETDQTRFDEAVASLEAAMPPMFSLKTELPPEPPEAGDPKPRPPEFHAALTQDGAVKIAGALKDEAAREAVGNYAAAMFGGDAVSSELDVIAEMPDGWSVRVFAALDVLELMRDGAMSVTLSEARFQGISHHEDFAATASETLGDRLDGLALAYDVAFVAPPPEPEPRGPSARECERQLGSVMAGGQIVFAPSSAEISDESEAILDEIAFIIMSCPDAIFEVGGHTDSQGREVMNQELSQSRAEVVRTSLMERKVFPDLLEARGYGEAEPIADNGSEEGRAQNRRIAFRLVNDPDAPVEDATQVQAVEEPATDGEESDGEN